METTWDGLPIAADEPMGATIVVRRRGDGQVLLLHRAVNGVDFEGEWAWTAPAGCRLPGEPIHAGALRELAEEAGLSGVDITPVDLSGRWALFTAEVGADAEVTLVDVEHDRFEWVPVEEAGRRIEPRYVADGLRRAYRTAIHDIAFRPLTRDDLGLLVTWRAAAHVRRWWTDPVADVAAAEAKYGPRIDGTAPTSVDIVLLDGRPVGFSQTTPSATDEDLRAVVAAAGAAGAEAVGIDYALGEPELAGRGLGSQVIWAYLRSVVFTRFPDARFAIAVPDPENTASVRACEKSGFLPAAEMARDGRRRVPMLLDRSRVLGPAPRADDRPPMGVDRGVAGSAHAEMTPATP